MTETSSKPSADQDIEDARAAIGRRQSSAHLLDNGSLSRFSLAIGGGGDGAEGQPALGHWSWFFPSHQDREIGPDGHPRRGDFLPALPSFPRRMFVSTHIAFKAPLVTDVWGEVTTRIADVVIKTGRSGDLVFVETERTVTQGDAVKIVERQTLVYRPAVDAKPLALPIPAPDANLVPANGEVWTPSPVNLFRFSAVTFNSHRIHYDAPYTRAVEGYPALVVHGPFIAAKLAELAARSGRIESLEFRAHAPSFVEQPIRLRPAGDGGFEAVRCDGVVAALLKAAYR